jgi:hypothetical protein
MGWSAEPEVDLREAITAACMLLHEHPSLHRCSPPKSVLSPLSHTLWAKRGRDWVPDDPYSFARRSMSKADLVELCSALKAWGDDKGEPIVNHDALLKIWAAWECYNQKLMTIPDHVPNQFESMLAATNVDRKSLADAHGFQQFLFQQIYPSVVSGDLAKAKEQLSFVLCAASSDSKKFIRIYNSDMLRKMQIEACIALMAFIGYVSEDGSEAYFVSRLKRMISSSDNRDFLNGRILSHGGHFRPGARNFINVLKMFEQGAKLDISTYIKASTYCYHNAARAALEQGGVLSDTLPEAGGKSIDWLLKKGLEQNNLYGNPDSMNRHKILHAISAANSGNFDGALNLTREVSEYIEKSDAALKHLELRVARVEATIYARLIEDSPIFLHTVRQRLATAHILATQLRIPFTVERIRQRRCNLASVKDWD